MLNKDELAKIDLVLEKAPENRHSYFQLRYFILKKEPTTQAQMWKCLSELQNRKEIMTNLEMDIEETKDQLELLEINQPRQNKEYEIRLRQHNRQKTRLSQSIEKMQKNLNFVCQEARFFLQAFEAISAKTELKDYDDFESQQEYWNEKISQAINLKILLGQPIDIELAQSALIIDNKRLNEAIQS